MSASNPFSADAIATCALQHYKSLPNHGKPRLDQEWTVYAALVVASLRKPNDKDNLPYVLCSATGSKCTTAGPEGWCLRDLHAEVLVKRGFQRLLWNEIQSGNFKILRKIEGGATSSDAMYSLHPDIQLHLYISDSPCGDATIYKLGNGDMNFTGAKLIVANSNDTDTSVGGLSCHDSATTVTREATQSLGQLRIKSGRSNLPSHLRSTSLSCSDKLLKWSLLGLQGNRLLQHHIVDPIRLASVVVSRDPHAESKESQQQALQRAILNRTNQVITELKENETFRQTKSKFLAGLESHNKVVIVVDQVYESAKSQLVAPFQKKAVTTSSMTNENGKRIIIAADGNEKKSKKVSPCGFCLNWQLDGEKVEVLVGARGTKQGKKVMKDADFVKQASRLCRRKLHQLQQTSETDTGTIHQAVSSHSLETKEAILSTSPLKEWIKTR